MTSMHKKSVFYCFLLTVALHSFAHADAPDLQTPSPVIYLQDNLDETANLGWCIDTVGRGFGEKIHSHSCKPKGGDVQFHFNTESGSIESVEFTGKCLTIVDSTDNNIPFGLLDCVADRQSQQFTYDFANLQFQPASDRSLCIAVGPASRKAGPFMSRDLLLPKCADTELKFSQWIVKTQ